MRFDAFSISEIVSNNNALANKRASNCRNYRVGYQSSNERYLFYTRCKESYSDPRGHIVTIKFDMEPIRETGFLTTKIIPSKVDMRVRCSCPAFLYWGSEYIATQLDYILEGYEENRFPSIRDPELKNTACKHVALVANAVLDNKNLYDLRNMRKPVASRNELSDYDAVKKTFDETEEISMQESLAAVELYLKRNNIESKKMNRFLSSINETNFEKTLLSLGMII